MQFVFRADCVCAGRADWAAKQPAEGFAPCGETSTRDGAAAPGWERATADLGPTQAHLRQPSGGSVSFTICWREAPGSETQLIRQRCCGGACVASAAPSAAFLVSLKRPVFSVAPCFPELRG